MNCPHCEFLHKTFIEQSNSTERDYYLMTEVFVYLHGGDVCNFSEQDDIEATSMLSVP